MRFFLSCVVTIACGFAQQMADPSFDTRAANPAYTSEHPKVVLDEAHRDFHTAEGRYKPLSDLLRSDGYNVDRGVAPFSARSLAGIRVLIIANALGENANAGTDTSPAAFTQPECEVVRDWVRGGGSLLLISDHTPFGMAAENLASALGVKLGKGFVFAPAPQYSREGQPTTLVFSRANGMLGDHPITRGRNEKEQLQAVVTFTGQSLSVPDGAAALLRLPPAAREAASRQQLRSAVNTGGGDGVAPTQGAQGIAMRFGKGRVVVLGEAAVLSAQVVRMPSGSEMKMGMNVPGSDDRQFALNIMHWLSGLLE